MRENGRRLEIGGVMYERKNDDEWWFKDDLDLNLNSFDFSYYIQEKIINKYKKTELENKLFANLD